MGFHSINLFCTTELVQDRSSFGKKKSAREVAPEEVVTGSLGIGVSKKWATIGVFEYSLEGVKCHSFYKTW